MYQQGLAERTHLPPTGAGLSHCRRADVRGTAIIDVVAVKVGGISVSALGTRAANEACRELRAVNGTVDFADYVVDLCFMTYEQGGLGADYADGSVSDQEWSGGSSAGSSSMWKSRRH